VRFAFVVGIAVGLSACGLAGGEGLRPHVATSTDAQLLLADVQRDWLDFRRADVGIKLRNECERFLVAYASDRSAPLVLAYLLAYLAQKSDYDAIAKTLVGRPLPPVGTARDLRLLVDARVLRVVGKRADSALEVLRPLVGKLVDPIGRELFLEEITLSALSARVDFEAIAYMDAWLVDATGEEQERARERVRELLVRMPFSVLEATYRIVRERGSRSGYSPELRRALFERLSAIAVEKGNSSLARWLVDETAVSRSGTEALLDLASSTRGIRLVKGRTVGLLLPGGREVNQDQAAEVVRGLSWALGLPRPVASAPGGVHLVTRDAGATPEQFDAALEELSGEGASVIIAGFDVASATRALAWGEVSGLTVLALTAPPRKAVSAARRGMVLGEDPADELEVLATALNGQKSRAVSVVEWEPPHVAEAVGLLAPSVHFLPPLSCSTKEAPAGALRFPVRDRARGGAWLVAGPPECLRDVARDISRAQEGRPKSEQRFIATTLEAGVAQDDPRIENVVFLALSSGIVPLEAGKSAESMDADVRGYMERFGGRPTYWSALGRDAGTLIKLALAPLPDDTATVDASIFQRRAIVDAGLRAAHAKLWSSDYDAMGPDRRLPRTIRVVRLGGVRH
jgi:hypothetical protein